jgi:hypothetical protein
MNVSPKMMPANIMTVDTPANNHGSLFLLKAFTIVLSVLHLQALFLPTITNVIDFGGLVRVVTHSACGKSRAMPLPEY